MKAHCSREYINKQVKSIFKNAIFDETCHWWSLIRWDNSRSPLGVFSLSWSKRPTCSASLAYFCWENIGPWPAVCWPNSPAGSFALQDDALCWPLVCLYGLRVWISAVSLEFCSFGAWRGHWMTGCYLNCHWLGNPRSPTPSYLSHLLLLP